MPSAIHYYRGADRTDLRNGQEWYPATHAWCVSVAERYGVSIDTTVAILAVLSQRKQWRSNKLETIHALQGKVPGTFNHVRRKVRRLLQGEYPERVVTGNKVLAFYHAIMGDTDAVVIDSWMMRAYGVSSGRLTPKEYRLLADKVRREAKDVGTEPRIYQATVWCAIRGAAH